MLPTGLVDQFYVEAHRAWRGPFRPLSQQIQSGRIYRTSS